MKRKPIQIAVLLTILLCAAMLFGSAYWLLQPKVEADSPAADQIGDEQVFKPPVDAEVDAPPVQPDPQSWNIESINAAKPVASREEDERWQEATRAASVAYQRARNLYFEHRYAEAFDEAQKTVDLAQDIRLVSIIDNGQRLQGKIRLAQGRYTEALELLKVDYKVGRATILDLDIALCYVKLGDLEMAKQFYSDSIPLRTNTLTAEDLPGTDTAQKFEATIRFAIGLDYYFSGRKQAAFEEFVAAEALAPNKGAISFYAGRTLVHLNRHVDSKPYFERAVKNSSGRILEDATGRYQRMR